MNNETCPKCQFPKMSASALDCPRCGIVFARYRRHAAASSAIPSPLSAAESPPSPSLAADESPFDWIDDEPSANFERPPQQARKRLAEPETSSLEWPPETRFETPPEPTRLLVDNPRGVSVVWHYLWNGPRSGVGSVWLLVGMVLALFICFSQWPRWVLGILGILIHELGHTVFAWIFGRPAIPSLDLVYGGGVTRSFDQSWLLVGFIAVLLYLPFARRWNVPAVNLRAGLCIVLYLVAAFTQVSEVFRIVGGHGLVVISVVYCLYKVMQGTDFKTPAEGPLYAVIGFFNLFQELVVHWQLATSSGFRADYEQAKGGLPSDFGHLTDIVGISVEPLAWLALLATLSSPLMAYLLFKHDAAWRAWLVERLAWLTGSGESEIEP